MTAQTKKKLKDFPGVFYLLYTDNNTPRTLYEYNT
jgi:hypothetical protein